MLNRINLGYEFEIREEGRRKVYDVYDEKGRRIYTGISREGFLQSIENYLKLEEAELDNPTTETAGNTGVFGKTPTVPDLVIE